MDILPSKPTEGQSIKATNKNPDSTYKFIDTNPHDYAEWFNGAMSDYSKNLFERGAIEKLPDYPEKTTLQMAVQLLKRHRDVFFSADDSDSPISIIITTLAAKSYKSDLHLTDALESIVNTMDSHIENVSGIKWVRNPVMKNENFADKWKEKKVKETSFYTWLHAAQKDLEELYSMDDISEIISKLHKMFDQKPVDRAVNNLGGKELFSISLNESISPALYKRNELNNISHKQKAPWPVPLWKKVKIECEVRDENDNHVCFYQSDGPALDKNLKLYFIPKTKEYKLNYVKWQITNTGGDARSKQCMRGDFVKSDLDGGGRLESTAYTGSHLVQCFILKNGQCVAKSKEFIVNIK